MTLVQLAEATGPLAPVPEPDRARAGPAFACRRCSGSRRRWAPPSRLLLADSVDGAARRPRAGRTPHGPAATAEAANGTVQRAGRRGRPRRSTRWSSRVVARTRPATGRTTRTSSSTSWRDTLLLDLDGDWSSIEPRDSAFYRAGTRHRWSSADGGPYRLLVVKQRLGASRRLSPPAHRTLVRRHQLVRRGRRPGRRRRRAAGAGPGAAQSRPATGSATPASATPATSQHAQVRRRAGLEPAELGPAEPGRRAGGRQRQHLARPPAGGPTSGATCMAEPGVGEQVAGVVAARRRWCPARPSTPRRGARPPARPPSPSAGRSRARGWRSPRPPPPGAISSAVTSHRCASVTSGASQPHSSSRSSGRRP